MFLRQVSRKNVLRAHAEMGKVKRCRRLGIRLHPATNAVLFGSEISAHSLILNSILSIIKSKQREQHVALESAAGLDLFAARISLSPRSFSFSARFVESVRVTA